MDNAPPTQPLGGGGDGETPAQAPAPKPAAPEPVAPAQDPAPAPQPEAPVPPAPAAPKPADARKRTRAPRKKQEGVTDVVQDAVEPWVEPGQGAGGRKYPGGHWRGGGPDQGRHAEHGG